MISVAIGLGSTIGGWLAARWVAGARSLRPTAVLLLDANQDVTSKGPLFKKAWAELYKDLIEYRPNSKAIDVDWRNDTVKLEFDDVKGDVLNVIPPQRAGDVAMKAGLVNARPVIESAAIPNRCNLRMSSAPPRP